MSPLLELPPQPNLTIQLAYATPDNVLGRPFYPADMPCLLHPEAMEKLLLALNYARNAGYGLHIFDAYRPPAAQQALWDGTTNAADFVSHPQTGACPHCRGVAVDITLTDATGTCLDMGSAFDDFSPLSWHGAADITPAAQHNRYVLIGIMTLAGWDFYRKEWWHYQLFHPRNYPVITNW